LKASNPLLLESPLSPLSDAVFEPVLEADLPAALDDLPEEELPAELLPLPVLDPDPDPLSEPLFFLAINCPLDVRVLMHPNPGLNVHTAGRKFPIV